MNVRADIFISAVVIAVTLATTPVRAQTDDALDMRKVEQLHLDDAFAGRDEGRAVELYLRALTRYGEPVANLRRVDLVVRDNGERVDTEDIEAETLGKSGLGMSCVLAIDNSRTMTGEPFERARSAALEFLGLMESRDSVAVVTFSDTPRVVAPFTASRADAKLQIQGLEVDRESLTTAFYDGVAKSVELIRLGANLPRRALVIVFSDGKDAGSARSLEQVIESAKGTDRNPPVLVFSIGYPRFGDEGLENLRKLSEQTGGGFLEAKSTVHLSTFFTEVWRSMNESYVVRYRGDLDGEPHEITVELEGQSDTHTAQFPHRSSPIWLYLAAVVPLVGATAALGLWVARWSSPGKLIVVAGPVVGEVFRLHGAKTRIGALADNEIVLPFDTVSRRHAAVHVYRGRVEIEDLNSANGTQVNGKPIQSAPLKPGDRIRLADVELVYER